MPPAVTFVFPGALPTQHPTVSIGVDLRQGERFAAQHLLLFIKPALVIRVFVQGVVSPGFAGVEAHPLAEGRETFTGRAVAQNALEIRDETNADPVLQVEVIRLLQQAPSGHL